MKRILRFFIAFMLYVSTFTFNSAVFAEADNPFSEFENKQAPEEQDPAEAEKTAEELAESIGTINELLPLDETSDDVITLEEIYLDTPVMGIEGIHEYTFVPAESCAYKFSAYDYDYSYGSVLFDLTDLNGDYVESSVDFEEGRTNQYAYLNKGEEYHLRTFPEGESFTYSVLISKAADGDIQKIDLSSDSQVSISLGSYTYSGSAIKPEPTVKYNGRTLNKGTDYVIQGYSNNVAVGTGVVYIVGTGFYTGRVEKSFSIEKRTGSPLSLTISSSLSGSYSVDKDAGIVITNYNSVDFDYSLSGRSGSNAYYISTSSLSTGSYTLKFTVYNYKMVARMVNGSYVYVKERSGVAYRASVTIRLTSSTNPTSVTVDSIEPGETQITYDDVVLSVNTKPTGGNLADLKWYTLGGIDGIHDGIISLDSLKNFKGKTYVVAMLGIHYAYWSIDTTGDEIVVLPMESSPVLTTDIRLNPSELNICVGEKRTLEVLVTPENASDTRLIWSSDNPEIAKVDDDGEVTALSLGTTTVRVRNAEGISAECKVNVNPWTPVQSVSLNPDQLNLGVGKTESLKVSVLPSNATNKTVIWSSSNPDVASVDENGNVTGNSKGAAVITAETEDGGFTAECVVTVTMQVYGVELDTYELDLAPGQSKYLTCSVLPENADNKNVVWSSSNPAVAAVDSNGRVTGIRLGTAYITVKTEDGGYTAECRVIVELARPELLTLSKYSAQTYVGYTSKLSAAVMPANADQTVTWSSSNPDVATVDGSGNIKALKAGTAAITARTVNGLWEQCVIRVLFTDVPASGVYYSDPVYWAVESGITNGYKDSDGFARTFKPKNNCTREAVVTFLWRLAGKPDPRNMNSPFSDIQDRSKYYYKAVLWAAENGITNGYSDGTFKPNATCLREHVVTFLYRYAGQPNPGTSYNPFNDIRSSDYYYKAVLWASRNGIANGYSTGAHAGGFGPKLDCLREHVVTFLYRFAH